MTINGNIECFLYINLETSFLENENPPSPYKTAISEANFKTNRKVSTKSTYQRHYAVKGLLKEKNMDFITTKVFCI